jgi:hypothetical protein
MRSSGNGVFLQSEETGAASQHSSGTKQFRRNLCDQAATEIVITIRWRHKDTINTLTAASILHFQHKMTIEASEPDALFMFCEI